MTDTSETQRSEKPAAPVKRGFVQRLLAVRPSDIATLVILCIVAGLVLAALRVDPAGLWVDFFWPLAAAWGRRSTIIASSAEYALRYVLLGAVLVVPIWLVWRLIRARRR